jgi:hypothetical protein
MDAKLIIQYNTEVKLMKREILILFALGIVVIFAAGCGTSSGKAGANPGYLIVNATNDVTYANVNANIYVNNALSGTAPKMITLDPGNYQLKLTATGYNDYYKSVRVTAGNYTFVYALMSPKCTDSTQKHCIYFDKSQGGPAWWQQYCRMNVGATSGVWVNEKACDVNKGCNRATGTCNP